ncbi:hypothetical protein [Arcobacter porcinus]|uniref:Uncharacterized protein n=1 Tax=Arcobacter porcinus TaxID=1935204 RepID=A0A1C0AVW4_9BACT|nr:hypothetical protein [Arcobacter porcinus]OCL88860.1 hypothetical protein AAX27_01989 [Aliarcobacter thereius]OCL81758.1 hypothetical protein AAW29_01731 [Arcobacter porcinus]OCL88278.1 hypothetical protein AAX30_00894 [Arcobacter porcinus]OCL90748.1 hypothetical protein AAX28_01565 [Arcobacter porcinus]QEP40408.1 hypothetical protein APORC_0795 [Arcobacter porcinus]
MENINFKELVDNKIVNSLDIIMRLKNNFTFLFNIDNIFSNEAGGKSRLNRDLFNQYNQKIQTDISELRKIFFDSNIVCFNEFKSILSNLNLFDSLKLNEFFIDDKILLNDLSSHLSDIKVPHKKIDEIISSIQETIDLKNRLNNLEFYLNIFDTSSLNKNLDKYTPEELINSSLIFDTINSYALLYEQLLRFDEEILNYVEENSSNSKPIFKNIEKLLEVLNKRADTYYYLDNRYKISLDYDLNIETNKEITIESSIVENIIFNLIEQSCLDTIKKDIKKGKTQKQIQIFFNLKKDILEVKISNNGFEVGNIDDVIALNSENKIIIETINLLNIFNKELFIESKENEGMSYNFSLNLN